MSKTFFNITVDPVNNIGVTLLAKEPDEPFGSTSTFLRVYKDNPEKTIAEKRFYSEDKLTGLKLYLTPSEDRVIRLLGLHVVLSVNKYGTVFAVIDSPDFRATLRLKEAEGTTEVPF